LFLFLLLILAVPICLIVLFVMLGNLRERVALLENQLADLRDAARGPLPEELPRLEVPGAEPPPRFEPPLHPPLPEPQWEEPEPEPEPEPGAEEPGETFGNVFERFVAGRLLVWIGGAALVGAAILLIKYSIEIGLLTPRARMIGAAVFGLALVAAGEAAPRIRRLSDDPRVAQALIGAGIITLYATPYGSHVLYALIDARTAALAMFLVSVAALVLSLRHGAAAALMGLIGGFLTPALVGDPSASAIPLLVYLTLLNGAVFGIAWRRGWTWLAAAAVVLSFLWSGYLLGRPPDDALAAGFFVIALALAAALVRPGRGPGLGWVQPLAIGLAELAFLVGRSDLGWAAWAMFGGLSAASVALALLRAEHRFAPAAALALAVLCIAAKAPTDDRLVPWAAIATTLLFAAYGIATAARADRLLRTAVAAAALAGPLFVLRIVRPELLGRPGWGLVALGLAAAALLLAWLQRGFARDEARADGPLLIAAGTATMLPCLAAFDLLPPDALPAGWLLVALGLAAFRREVRDTAFTAAACVAAALAVGDAARLVPELWSVAAGSLVGSPAMAGSLPEPGRALLVLALPAALLLTLAPLLGGPPRLRRLAAIAAAVLGLAALYVLAKQPFGIASREEFELWGFAERTAITQMLFALGWASSSRRLRLPRVDPDHLARLGGAITLVAALRLIWFDMLIHNPLLDPQWVGSLPVLNLLLPAYFLSALWLYDARRRADAETRSGFWLAAFLAALVAGVMLAVRQVFQGPILADLDSWPLAEIYMYSLAGLLLSAALIVGGIRLKDKAVRLAGLALLAATVLKVFGSDASALEGILRILSFFGLGVGLIGVALLYGPVLRAEGKAAGRK
jgi:uncharacterized membrane protein